MSAGRFACSNITHLYAAFVLPWRRRCCSCRCFYRWCVVACDCVPAYRVVGASLQDVSTHRASSRHCSSMYMRASLTIARTYCYSACPSSQCQLNAHMQPAYSCVACRSSITTLEAYILRAHACQFSTANVKTVLDYMVACKTEHLLCRGSDDVGTVRIINLRRVNLLWQVTFLRCELNLKPRALSWFQPRDLQRRDSQARLEEVWRRLHGA